MLTTSLTRARSNLARAVAHTIDHLSARGTALPAELLAWRGTVDVFYNPNHDDKGRFAEGDGGGYATSGGALPALGADDVRVVHLTSADAAQEIAQKGLNYENQGMAQSTSRAWADANDVQLTTDDPRFAGATAVVFDIPATDWRRHNDVVRSPGIIQPKYIVGIIPPSDNHSADSFARGSGTPGRKRKEVEAVNDYQAELDSEYGEWADDAATQLAEEPDDDARKALLLALLLLLLARLRKLGAANLPDAVSLASGGGPSAAAWAALAKAVEANDNNLMASLIPAIQQKLLDAMGGPEWTALIGEVTAIKDYLFGLFRSFAPRVASYAGEWWRLEQEVFGISSRESGRPIRWVRDEQAVHCDTCLRYGEQTYESWDAMLDITGGAYPCYETDCGPNCRCEIMYEDDIS